MRGKAAEIMAEHDAEGITPAYAGKSENSSRLLSQPLGSPPPMRGKASTLATPFP